MTPHEEEILRKLAGDPERLSSIRRAIAEVKPGLWYFNRFLKDPEMVAVYKADIIQGAVEDNARQPPDKRRPEDAVREYEEWCFSLIGI
jgi:hypothetical protein